MLKNLTSNFVELLNMHHLIFKKEKIPIFSHFIAVK